MLTKVANYFARNAAYMHYDQYLAHGSPIASGVIEGACRHLVKDRCELSGMRWTKAGVENLLRLRAVAENDDWDAYRRFFQQQRQQRLYGVPAPAKTCLKTKPWLIHKQRSARRPQAALSSCPCSSHAAQRSLRNGRRDEV